MRGNDSAIRPGATDVAAIDGVHLGEHVAIREGGWKRRISRDCRRTPVGPSRAPMWNGWVPQSKGTPTIAARHPGLAARPGGP